MGIQPDDTAIATRAILELTDAGVSPALDEAWEAAVADVRHEAEDERAPFQDAVSDAVAAAEAFG